MIINDQSPIMKGSRFWTDSYNNFSEYELNFSLQ